MAMVKVFSTNENGKIEFTQEELESLLNEVWNDGYNRHGIYWWDSPGIRTTPFYATSKEGITISCDTLRGNS